MIYIYIAAGTIFTLALVTQMLAFAAFAKKQRAATEKSHFNKD
ncbi:MAG: hypothetical protein WC007_18705 [Pelobacteraceae bacterium]